MAISWGVFIIVCFYNTEPIFLNSCIMLFILRAFYASWSTNITWKCRKIRKMTILAIFPKILQNGLKSSKMTPNAIEWGKNNFHILYGPFPVLSKVFWGKFDFWVYDHIWASPLLTKYFWTFSMINIIGIVIIRGSSSDLVAYV